MHQKRHRSRADSIHHRWRQIRLQIGNLQAALPSSPCRRAVVALRMKTDASLQLERVAHLMPLLDGSNAPTSCACSRLVSCEPNGRVRRQSMLPIGSDTFRYLLSDLRLPGLHPVVTKNSEVFCRALARAQTPRAARSPSRPTVPHHNSHPCPPDRSTYGCTKIKNPNRPS